jgi:hypothetical protein
MDTVRFRSVHCNWILRIHKREFCSPFAAHHFRRYAFPAAAWGGLPHTPSMRHCLPLLPHPLPATRTALIQYPVLPARSARVHAILICLARTWQPTPVLACPHDMTFSGQGLLLFLGLGLGRAVCLRGANRFFATPPSQWQVAASSMTSAHSRRISREKSTWEAPGVQSS